MKNKLPPKVHPKGPSLYYVDKGKWHRLCAIDAPEHELHGAIWRYLRRGVDTLSAVMQSFKANALPNLSMAAQSD